MAAATVITPAVVLGSLRYGETSRIVRLMTRDRGMVTAIAKGASRPRSRFGAALQLLSEGHAHLIASRSSEMQTLAAFDLLATHSDVARELTRFTAAMALAELVTRVVAPVANAALYDDVRAHLALIELGPVDAVGVVALRALWRVIADLGLAPAVNACARDGSALPVDHVGFSYRAGGCVCALCAREGVATRLAARDRGDLALLVSGGEVPLLDPPRDRAHRRLLLRWIREHVAGGDLPAVEAWAAEVAA